MLGTINDIEFLSNEQLGEGAYSKVFKVRHRASDKTFALKFVNLTRLISSN